MRATTADRPPPVSGWWRRGWSLPLWVHTAALALVLLAALALSRPGVAFTSDEGAAILQARVLEDTGGWTYEDPLAEIDPEGEARPFLRGDLGTEGLAPYARHPLYPLVLAGADRAAGGTGMALTSVAGTLVASVAAALLGRRFGPSLDRWALWTCGLASPLFFDAYLVLGHTIAAAAAGLAVLAAVHALERDRGRGALRALVGLAVAVAVATAVRSEGAFVGPAVAVGTAAAWWRRAVPRSTALVVGVVALGATAVVALAERVALTAIVGDRLPTEADAAPASWLGGRLEGVVATWFDPSYGDDAAIVLVLTLGAVLVAFTALLARLAPGARTLLVVGSVAVVAAYAVRLALDPGAVPGLWIAFPVGWAAVWLLGRHLLATPSTRLVSVAAAAVVALVLLTQYARGGGLEWGGRYFAVALPLVVPPLVASMAEAGARLDDRTRRVLLGSAVVVSLLVAATALRTVRHVHDQTDAVLDSVASLAPSADRPAGLDRPVVVAWNRLLPQIAWRDFDDYAWVVPSRDLIPEYLDRLAGLGVDRVVLVTPDSTRDLPELPVWTVVGRAPPGQAQEVLLLQRRGE